MAESKTTTPDSIAALNLSPLEAGDVLWDAHALLQSTMARIEALMLHEAAITEDASGEIRRMCRMAAQRISDVACCITLFDSPRKVSPAQPLDVRHD